MNEADPRNRPADDTAAPSRDGRLREAASALRPTAWVRDSLTALVLTYNEAPNIVRVLDRLRWVPRVLLVDSGSTDDTLVLARRYPNVDIVTRPFTSFAEQCNFGLSCIDTEWVLSLDADYVLTLALVAEMECLANQTEVSGYRASFIYCIDGRPLRATLYPPRTVLYRTHEAFYVNDGHGHRVSRSGRIVSLGSQIFHDDRKPLSRWLSSQSGYVRREVAKLLDTPSAKLSRIDRIRRIGLAPLLTPFYCLFVKRLILDGRVGFTYTWERTYAEVLLALTLSRSASADDPEP